jgi:hypothetical protein
MTNISKGESGYGLWIKCLGYKCQGIRVIRIRGYKS